MRFQSSFGLYDSSGHRKYLTLAEGRRYLEASRLLPVREAVFCRTLLWTGCRISEALELEGQRLDFEGGRLIIRSLKRHHRGQASEHAPARFRIVPVPQPLMDELLFLAQGQGGLLWPWSRQAGWRLVKWVMDEAGICGVHACPKGLRHHFGLMAVAAGVPPSLIMKWMGHAKLETTMIYLDVMDGEELAFAERMWQPEEELQSARHQQGGEHKQRDLAKTKSIATPILRNC